MAIPPFFFASGKEKARFFPKELKSAFSNGETGDDSFPPLRWHLSIGAEPRVGTPLGQSSLDTIL